VTVADGASPLVEADSSILSTTIDTSKWSTSDRQPQCHGPLLSWSPAGEHRRRQHKWNWNNMPGGAWLARTLTHARNQHRSARRPSTTEPQPFNSHRRRREMTISTAQLDLSGTGLGMRISIVTSGTMPSTDGFCEDSENTVLQANSCQTTPAD